MKVSKNWLSQYTKITVDTDELVDLIGKRLGEVEQVDNWTAKYSGAVFVKVVGCKPHPDADKLTVCLIDDNGVTKNVDRNKDGFVQVVCGAPNAAKGLITVWLPPGSTVPSTFNDEDPFVLSPKPLRGVVSNGMLSSPREMAFSDEHEGIIEVDLSSSFKDPKTEKEVVGLSVADAFGLDDVIIDIENKMFTHRPDCFGIIGVAREVAGITGTKFTSPDWYQAQVDDSKAENEHLQVKIEDQELSSRMTAIAMDGISNGPSPLWLQAYLTTTGIRSISLVVDLTAYFMHLTAQPIHAYDYDKVAKLCSNPNKPVLIARAAKKGETCALLNGKTITFNGGEAVISTDKEVLGVAGIMGGSSTEVDMDTTSVIVESANFNMYSVRKTSMAHGLFTDALARFNKGQSPWQTSVVLSAISDEMSSISVAKLMGDMVNEQSKLIKNPEVIVSSDFINVRLGTSLSATDISKLLKNVEFEVSTQADELSVSAPFWRTDIEIPEDIVEEVGRLHGYENIDLVLPKISAKPTQKNKLLESKAKVRSVLAASGANEVTTYSFVNSSLLKAVGQDPGLSFALTNALSPDLEYYRQSLTPSLLSNVHSNIKSGHTEFAIFEMGVFHTKLHKDDGIDSLPKEFASLAMVHARKSKKGESAYFYAKAYLDQLSKSLGFEIDYIPMGDIDYPITKPYESSRSALVMHKSEPIGIVGEIKSNVAENLKLPLQTAGFELDMDSLSECIGQKSAYKQLAKFPSTNQDLTVNVAKEIKYTEVRDKLEKALKTSDLNSKYNLVSIYDAGKTIAYTFNLEFYKNDATLTTDEVTKNVENIAGEFK